MSTIHREPLGARKGLYRRQAPESSDYANFETHTLLHDVFLAQNGKQIVAIGPPLLNLASVLTPVLLTITGWKKPIKARCQHRARFSCYRFDLPKALHHATSLGIEVSFGGELRFDFQIARQVCRPAELQLITLQKNNEVAWILDWIQYYAHLGVDRILLYDNGSDNIAELEQALQNLPSDVELILVRWHYAYGPSTSTRNRFCQSSQNNHAYYCFGQAAWAAHFDIDEYLVINDPDVRKGNASGELTASADSAGGSTGQSIQGGALRRLIQRAPRSVGQLRFDSYWVPNAGATFSESSDSVMPSIRDFPYRNRAARGKAHKYVAKQQALSYANTHNCKLKVGYRRRHVKTEEAAFLHYKALTDDWRVNAAPWKQQARRGSSEVLDERQHVKEPSVIETMQMFESDAVLK
ncbi:MAG: glycosyltransferase family 92 protein [Granulosicoccus sp.]